MKPKQYQAKVIAEAILACSDPELGDIVTNLKLQKLLYYTQGFSLAINDKSLFSEPITKWQYGPVVVPVYFAYKDNGSNGIFPSPDFDLSTLEENDWDLVREVYEVYGQFSAWKLMEMTHNEKPWLEAEMNGIISNNALKDFFQTLVVK